MQAVTFTSESAPPHATGDGRSVGDGTAGFERFVERDGVQQNGLVERSHERVDGLLEESVVELVLGNALDLVREVQVLFRVGHPRRHRQQRLVRLLRPPVHLRRVALVVPRP